MSKDDEIRRGLIKAGVPAATHKTTLVLEGRQDLRDAVMAHTCFAEDHVRGFWVASRSPRLALKARNLFLLIAKETFLTRRRVQCEALVDIVGAICGDNDELLDRLDGADMVFVLDFYEAGCGRPFDDFAFGRMRAWIKRRFSEGRPVSFLSEGNYTEAGHWWPSALMDFVENHTIDVEVTA